MLAAFLASVEGVVGEEEGGGVSAENLVVVEGCELTVPVARVHLEKGF